MKNLTVPDLVLLVGTRAALGAGMGLVIGDKLNSDTRRGAGWALIAVGVLTTIPIAMGAMCHSKAQEQETPASL
ncbi:MAG TPA: hypothetical protein VFJ58_06030 [Armatimonadota bacterium]|nr:hypothetical protein [Armatimonadota bacterium]